MRQKFNIRSLAYQTVTHNNKVSCSWECLGGCPTFASLQLLQVFLFTWPLAARDHWTTEGCFWMLSISPSLSSWTNQGPHCWQLHPAATSFSQRSAMLSPRITVNHSPGAHGNKVREHDCGCACVFLHICAVIQ